MATLEEEEEVHKRAPPNRHEMPSIEKTLETTETTTERMETPGEVTSASENNQELCAFMSTSEMYLLDFLPFKGARGYNANLSGFHVSTLDSRSFSNRYFIILLPQEENHR